MPVLSGIALIAAMAGILWLIAAHISKNAADLQPRIGSDVFNSIVAIRAADDIAHNGPQFYRGLVGAGGDIYVSHVGTDPQRGWYTFAARVPGSERKCTLRWRPADNEMHDPCTDVTYPLDGGSLPHYPTGVTSDGHVEVDLTPGGAPGRGPTVSTGGTTG